MNGTEPIFKEKKAPIAPKERYRDLEREASRPPWKVTTGFTLSTACHRYVAQFDASETPEFARVDVRLAAHCRNKFPVVLEKLREIAEDADARLNASATKRELLKLIDEMETLGV